MKNILISIFILSMASCTSAEKAQAHPQEVKITQCLCPKDFRPVCGSDKKMYPNACSAECAGIKTFTKGNCK